MKIDYGIVKFTDLELQTRDAHKIRGFFGNKYKDNEMMHNHGEKGFIFEYPKVQYKVIGNTPMIIGLQEGCKTILNVGTMEDEMVLDGKSYETFQKEAKWEKVEVTSTEDYVEYDFVTPWIALNQKNIDQYNRASLMEKENILKKILIGNIISFSKGIGYTVDRQLQVWLDVKEVEVQLKGIAMRGFKGKFKVNFQLPQYVGIGKSVSRGFGTVSKSRDR